jgi:NAD(P)-dependent dehydrogenase (short-subunit alcohol dehydrogenase family)
MSPKIALITGASRGFGAAMAEGLAAAGYHVLALARTVGALEELDDRIQATGGSATLVPLDINDQAGLERLCLSIYERWGGLDLWLHSAIFAGPLSPVGHIPDKDWDKTLATNIRATQQLISMIDPLLKAKKGTAILPVDNVSGQKFQAAYGAAKSAQKALWDSWAAESMTIGPSVKTFEPKPMPTALRARFFPGEDRSALTAPKVEAARLLAQILTLAP